jgi:G3E family GTPase
MRTTVVCGLLGSGKTTFVAEILRGSTEKAVVLVNDFGSAGIDGEILSAGGLRAVEIPSGCVCCELRGELISAVSEIMARYRPAHLVIEPSGVASPSGVLDALQSAGAGPPTVVGVVDATEFAELYGSGMYGAFLREQVTLSDVILVNKVDLAEEGQAEGAERLLGALNPHAVIYKTVMARMPGPLPEARKQRPRAAGGGRGLHVETVSARLRGKARHREMQRLFDELASGALGGVTRAKALVDTDMGPYRYDLASREVSAVPFEKAVSDSRLVVIGSGLRRGEILRRAAAA